MALRSCFWSIIDRPIDALEDDARETNDRVERGAQLMAHIRQELALHPVDFLHVFNRFLRELVCPGIFDGDSDLVSQNLEYRYFVLVEGVDFCSTANPGRQ